MPAQRPRTTPKPRRSPGIPVLRAKLVRPNLPGSVLQRPRLVGALAEHAERPLSLVVAEAGFGKTTLLAAFTEKLRRPVVWYSLMPTDADPVVFGRHLLSGLRDGAPRFGRGFERALEEAPAGAAAGERLAGILIHELSELTGPPVLIVLDDFHELAEQPAIVGLVDALLRQLPETVRLLIGTRGTPPLALERMRVRGELFELDASHLRFTRDELARLFAEVHRRPLADAELSALEQATLGWPTAVQLVHESLQRAPDRTLEAVLAEFHDSNLALQDYLSSEVHARLAPDERRVLERVAALQRFEPELATELSGVRDAAGVLRRLERRGLTRSFGASAGTSFELHDLVRQFLRARARSQEGAEAWSALERDTAELLESRNEPERALRHFLNAGESARAAALTRGLAPRLLREGRAATLLQYLIDLPQPVVHGDPELLLALADARQLLGQWDDAERLYGEALPRCEELGQRALVCRTLLGLSKVLNMRGRHEEVLGMAERGLAMVDDADLDTRIRLLQRKAGAHFYLGQPRAAERILTQVRELLPRATDRDLELPTMHNLAMAYAAMGRYRESSRAFEAALAHVRGEPTSRAPLYLSNLALLLIELGELAEAKAVAEEGLAAARQFRYRAPEITCREALAQILALSGDLDGALAELREAETMNKDQRMEVIAGDLLALKGRIFSARGQHRRGIEFLRQAIERIGDRDRPRLVEFKGLVAWCELRAGRPHAARDLLLTIAPRADAAENDFERMRIHYWLAEARLALGEADAGRADLALALATVRERGYGYFLATQAREDPAPLLAALEHGIEVDVVAAALAEAGTAVEAGLLERLDGASTAVGEAIVAVLGETGGSRSLEALGGLARSRRALQPAIRTALRQIEARLGHHAPAATAKGPAVRLQLFGPPRLEVDGRQVPASVWRAQRAFHVLIYLALHPRGANRDTLLETFWPGRQLAAGRKNFHPTLSYIRSVLPAASKPPLLREGELYRLEPGYPFSCDVWDLDRLLDEARNTREPRARRDALERAADLAQQPLLEGLYGDWADELQAKVRDRLERVLLEGAALSMKLQDWERALGGLRRAAEIDGFRESTRADIVECLVRLGNRRAAVVEYERLTTLLRDELGVTPLPETESRVQALLGVAAGPAMAAGAAEDADPEMMQRAAPQRIAASAQVPFKARAGGSSR